MSMRWLNAVVSRGIGAAARTDIESYSPGRAIRIVRVSDVAIPGPLRVLPSRAIARIDTTSPPLRPSVERSRVADSEPLRELPKLTTGVLIVRALMISPDPVEI